MPVTKGQEFKKFDTLGLTRRPDSIQAEGRIKYLNEKVIGEGGEANAGVVKLLPIPKGCLVDPTQCAIIGGAVTGLSVTVGTAADPDKYGTINAAAAGTKVFNASAVDLIKVEDEDLQLTFTAAGSFTTNSAIRVRMAYYVR